MNKELNHQDQTVSKTIPKYLILSTDDVVKLVERMGYNLETFLNTCGVKYNTFQHWKKGDTIPNDSALVLFNYINDNPESFNAVRKARIHVLEYS